MERAIAAHGDSIDGAIGAAGCDSVALLDERKKFLNQEILVKIVAVFGVDVEGCAAVWCSDEEIL